MGSASFSLSSSSAGVNVEVFKDANCRFRFSSDLLRSESRPSNLWIRTNYPSNLATSIILQTIVTGDDGNLSVRSSRIPVQ